MQKKLLVALIASAFAMGAYAQAQKAEPKKGETGTTTQPATPPSTSAKGDTKVEGKTAKKARKAKTAKASKAKTDDAKDSRKDATKKSDTATSTDKKGSPK
jgi:hypothetical protein